MDHSVDNIFDSETILHTILNSHPSVDALTTRYPKLLLPLELYESDLDPVVKVEDIRYTLPLPHPPDNPRHVKLHPCGVCGSVYLLKKNLKEHLKVHHVCRYCRAVFTSSTSLNHHLERLCRKRTSTTMVKGVELVGKELKYVRGLLKANSLRLYKQFRNSSTQTDHTSITIETLPGGSFRFKNLLQDVARQTVPLKIRPNGRLNTFKAQICRNQQPRPLKHCDTSTFEICDLIEPTSIFSFVQCFPLSSNTPHLTCRQVKLLEQAVKDAKYVEMSWQDFKDIEDCEGGEEVLIEAGKVYADSRKARLMQNVIGDVVEVKSTIIKVLASPGKHRTDGGSPVDPLAPAIKEEEFVKCEAFENVFLVE